MLRSMHVPFDSRDIYHLTLPSLLFSTISKEHREKVKADNPDLSFGGVGKKLGEMWRALSDKEKEEYKTRKA